MTDLPAGKARKAGTPRPAAPADGAIKHPLARRLPVGVVAPACHRAVPPQPAGVRTAGSDGSKCAARRCGLPVQVATPAADGAPGLFRVAVGINGAGVGAAGGDGAVGVGFLVEGAFRGRRHGALAGSIATVTPDSSVAT